MRRLIVAWLLLVAVRAARGAEWWVIALLLVPPVLIGLLIRAARCEARQPTRT